MIIHFIFVQEKKLLLQNTVESMKHKGREFVEKIDHKSSEIINKWEEKSREFMGNFLEMFGKDGRLVIFSLLFSLSKYLNPFVL